MDLPLDAPSQEPIPAPHQRGAPYRLFRPTRFWHVEVRLRVEGKTIRVRRSTKSVTRAGAEDAAVGWKAHLERTFEASPDSPPPRQKRTNNLLFLNHD